jgi:EAL domain-containing protein (putative c-di-GMP-specific phosphodiesterase class I)
MAIRLAHGFDLTVVAEGVETPAVAAILTAEGCDIAQGYLYDKPLRAEEFAARWLQDGAHAPAPRAHAGKA